MLMFCPHDSMYDLRIRFLDDVKSLCQSADPQLPGTPEFPISHKGRSEIWAVMMLCTTAVSFPHGPAIKAYHHIHVPLPVSEQRTSKAQEIRARSMIIIPDDIRHASGWIYAVMEAWRSKLRDYHVPGEASAMTGAKLAALVCKHMRAVFRTHRRALKNDWGYSVRNRDPLPSVDMADSENALEAESALEDNDGI